MVFLGLMVVCEMVLIFHGVTPFDCSFYKVKCPSKRSVSGSSGHP